MQQKVQDFLTAHNMDTARFSFAQLVDEYIEEMTRGLWGRILLYRWSRAMSVWAR